MVSVNLWHTLLVAAIVHETQQRQIWKWCWLSVYVYVRINYNKTMMRCQARLTVCTHNLLPLLIHWLWNKQTNTHTLLPLLIHWLWNKHTHTHTHTHNMGNLS